VECENGPIVRVEYYLDLGGHTPPRRRKIMGLAAELMDHLVQLSACTLAAARAQPEAFEAGAGAVLLARAHADLDWIRQLDRGPKRRKGKSEEGGGPAAA
jgi:hypothetical protein